MHNSPLITRLLALNGLYYTRKDELRWKHERNCRKFGSQIFPTFHFSLLSAFSFATPHDTIVSRNPQVSGFIQKRDRQPQYRPISYFCNARCICLFSSLSFLFCQPQQGCSKTVPSLAKGNLTSLQCRRLV